MTTLIDKQSQSKILTPVLILNFWRISFKSSIEAISPSGSEMQNSGSEEQLKSIDVDLTLIFSRFAGIFLENS